MANLGLNCYQNVHDDGQSLALQSGAGSSVHVMPQIQFMRYSICVNVLFVFVSTKNKPELMSQHDVVALHECNSWSNNVHYIKYHDSVDLLVDLRRDPGTSESNMLFQTGLPPFSSPALCPWRHRLIRHIYWNRTRFRVTKTTYNEPTTETLNMCDAFRLLGVATQKMTVGRGIMQRCKQL